MQLEKKSDWISFCRFVARLLKKIVEKKTERVHDLSRGLGLNVVLNVLDLVRIRGCFEKLSDFTGRLDDESRRSQFHARFFY